MTHFLGSVHVSFACFHWLIRLGLRHGPLKIKSPEPLGSRSIEQNQWIISMSLAIRHECIFFFFFYQCSLNILKRSPPPHPVGRPVGMPGLSDKTFLKE